MTSNIKQLDPVQGLVDYVLDIKPYHTKIIEVLIEHVHEDLVDVAVNDVIETKIDLTSPTDKIEFFGCEESGFGGSLFGSPKKLPITSPNPSVTFENYPAINVSESQFIVPGDYSGSYLPGLSVRISLLIEDHSDVHSIIDVTSGPAGSGAFLVSGNHTTTFVNGYQFYVVQAGTNDKAYTVASSSFDGTNTTITVDQSVPSDDATGYLGIQKLDPQTLLPGAFTEDFTISSSEFNHGFIDSWPDVNDPNTYTPGNNEHTIVTVSETLPSLPSLGSDQYFVATATLQGLLIEEVLYYSNYLPLYDSSVPERLQTPDEGYITLPIVNVTTSTVVVNGDLTVSNIFSGDIFNIIQSASNNGTYTIDNLSYNSGSNQTTITITGTFSSLIADGYFRFDVPSNVFIVDGNHTSRFRQGVIFEVAGGSTAGFYNVLSSDFINGQTRIRVAENIIEDEGRTPLVETTTDFVVQGDKTSTFVDGVTQFNVIGTLGNDGFYIVDTSTYDSVNDQTLISVAETLIPSVGGEIQIFTPGLIREVFIGFGEETPFCSVIPETMVRAHFDEHLSFDGLGIGVEDDVIVYNLENNDDWGLELPINTLVSSSQPLIPEQTTAPPDPSFNDLWFDTTSNIFRQWTGFAWKGIVTAHWLDTDTGLMYYRTKNSFIDTNWVLYFASPPGLDHYIPAQGSYELLGFELFIAQGATDVDYQLTSLSVPGAEPGLITVLVNGLPANVDLTSATEFTILNPILQQNDTIEARVYDTTGTVTNAHVGPFGSVEPHTVLHSDVEIDDTNNAYIFRGGNFLDRLVPTNTFQGITLDGSVGVVGDWATTTLPIVAISQGTSTISVSGNFTWLFEAGTVFRTKSFINEHHDYIVDSSSFDGTNTNIITTFTDGYSEIQRYSGVLYSAVYNPIVNSNDTTDQVKTIAYVGGVVDTNVDLIRYSWEGPVRFSIGLQPQEPTDTIISDLIGMSNELISLPQQLTIVDTDQSTNTIRIHYENPETNDPVDLSDSFHPGSIIQIAGSYGNSTPQSIETNDALYVVNSVTFDAGGTDDTVIVVETDFGQIPPYATLDVTNVTNTGGGTPGNNQLVVVGDVTGIFSNNVNNVFVLSEPLVSATPLENAITVLTAEFSGGNTTITVDENFIDEAFTGSLDIIDSRYRGSIIYDENNATPNWSHGYLLREGLSVTQQKQNVADTTFTENLDFGWGTVQQWAISSTDASNNIIVLNGDFSNVIEPFDSIQITGSQGNDGNYQVSSVTYIVGPNNTEIIVDTDLPVDPPTGLLGYVRLEDIDITNWFQYLIQTLDSGTNIITVNGDATNDIQVNQQIRVLGTLNNNGIFDVTSTPSFNGITTDIPVNSITETESGGWIESAKDFGIRILLSDTISSVFVEDAEGAVLSEGSIIGGWDYGLWDVGSFDEGLDTVIHLYSNSF